VDPGALARLSEFTGGLLSGRRLALITDTTVLALFERFRRAALEEWVLPPSATGATPAPTLPEFAAELSVPSGEASKTRERWAQLSDALLERGFVRDSAIVALGGGMVGDLGGFVAATFLRGIPCLQVPTTLLAMLDASVGGKTAVDTAHGKNLIGAFHPPVAVIADPLVLRTLPEREFRGGLAEAVKHGLIADENYFAWIGEKAKRIAERDVGTLTHLIHRSVEIKAAVVAEDEREAGRRAILNAGHTVAHAIEHASGYGLSHGEAVAIGLVTECRLAEAMGIGQPGLATRVASLLEQLGLPTRLDGGLPYDRVREAMSVDKKNREATVRFALPTQVGVMNRGDGWTVAPPISLVAACLEGRS
jgi:3-dehydroquinate synthase